MANVKYLSYDGLTHYTEKIKNKFEAAEKSIISITNLLSDLQESINTHTHTQYAPTSHTHAYLPLSGGTMTGNLTAPSMVFNGSDVDRNIIRINNGTGDLSAKSNYGFTLKYLCSGTGNDNALSLYSDNQTASSQIQIAKWLQDGTLNSRSILPISNNTYSLGSASYKWANVYATTFTGNLTGNAYSASYININNSPNNGDFPLTFVSNTTTGNQGLYVSTGKSLTFNPSTGNLKATTFTGNLTGNVTGNADTATKASTVAIAANSADVACELWFQDSTRDGSRGKLTYDNDLRYNPSKNTLMIGGMTSSVTSPTTANVVLDGTNKKLSLGESYIQYNSSTGCLEIIA